MSLADDKPHTFRLASYSDEKLIEVVTNNLDSLEHILEYNQTAGLHFFRLSSDLVPFASHPVCTFDWRSHFQSRFAAIGQNVLAQKTRISMHPGQYVLLNSPQPEVVQRSIAELQYHADLLDLMGLASDAKLQIHVGGVYGDKPTAMQRFIETYKKLPTTINSRLAVENDERQYCLADCLQLHQQCGIPIIYDVFHHNLFNTGESSSEGIELAQHTWGNTDGILMVDYSSQDAEKQRGAHTQSVDLQDLEVFLSATTEYDFDLMLEIKDKENSAIQALHLAREIRNSFSEQP